MDSSLRRKYQWVARDHFKIAESSLPILPWTMIKLRYMEQEFALNHYKKFKKFQRHRK
jgi:hypothetical protein